MSEPRRRRRTLNASQRYSANYRAHLRWFERTWGNYYAHLSFLDFIQSISPNPPEPTNFGDMSSLRMQLMGGNIRQVLVQKRDGSQEPFHAEDEASPG